MDLDFLNDDIRVMHPFFKQNQNIDDLNCLIETLSNKGHQVWFAGGAVRDFLLGKPFHDLDIVTSAKPDEVEKLFAKTLSVGKSFGVIHVILNGKSYEVASFRKDGEYQDGRRPSQVVFSGPEADAKRRDFTMNALFYDPVDDKIYDFVSGKKDIEARLVRCVGVPEERFQEDHLRLLRAIRFSASLSFSIEEKTKNAIHKNKLLVLKVSKERLREEFSKGMGQNPFAFLALLNEFSFLSLFFKSLEFQLPSEDSVKKRFLDLWQTSLLGASQGSAGRAEDMEASLLSVLSRPDVLSRPQIWLALVFWVSQNGMRLLKRLKREELKDLPVCEAVQEHSWLDLMAAFQFSNQERKEFLLLVRWPFFYLLKTRFRPGSLRDFLFFKEGLILKTWEQILGIPSYLSLFQDYDRYMHHKPLIKGGEVLEFPLQERKDILREVWYLQLEEKIKSKEEAQLWITKRKISNLKTR